MIDTFIIALDIFIILMIYMGGKIIAASSKELEKLDQILTDHMEYHQVGHKN